MAPSKGNLRPFLCFPERSTSFILSFPFFFYSAFSSKMKYYARCVALHSFVHRSDLQCSDLSRIKCDWQKHACGGCTQRRANIMRAFAMINNFDDRVHRLITGDVWCVHLIKWNTPEERKNDLNFNQVNYTFHLFHIFLGFWKDIQLQCYYVYYFFRNLPSRCTRRTVGRNISGKIERKEWAKVFLGRILGKYVLVDLKCPGTTKRSGPSDDFFMITPTLRKHSLLDALYKFCRQIPVIRTNCCIMAERSR